MSDAKHAKLIFEKWCAELRDMNRTKDYLYSNFFSLFEEMKRIDVPFDIAHPYLKDAVIKHLPSSRTVRETYKKSPISRRCTEQEFFEEWKSLIQSKAYAAFHDLYPLNSEDNAEKEEKAELPKGMSREEYKLQRKHAESFPVLDLSKIDDPYKASEEYGDFSIEDLE